MFGSSWKGWFPSGVATDGLRECSPCTSVGRLPSSRQGYGCSGRIHDVWWSLDRTPCPINTSLDRTGNRRYHVGCASLFKLISGFRAYQAQRPISQKKDGRQLRWSSSFQFFSLVSRFVLQLRPAEPVESCQSTWCQNVCCHRSADPVYSVRSTCPRHVRCHRTTDPVYSVESTCPRQVSRFQLLSGKLGSAQSQRCAASPTTLETRLGTGGFRDRTLPAFG